MFLDLTVSSFYSSPVKVWGHFHTFTYSPGFGKPQLQQVSLMQEPSRQPGWRRIPLDLIDTQYCMEEVAVGRLLALGRLVPPHIIHACSLPAHMIRTASVDPFFSELNPSLLAQKHAVRQENRGFLLFSASIRDRLAAAARPAQPNRPLTGKIGLQDWSTKLPTDLWQFPHSSPRYSKNCDK